MATTAKCGSTGSISLGGEITNWEVNLNQDIPEATSMASGGTKEYIACLQSADGSFESVTPVGFVGYNAQVDFVNDIETITCDIIITDVTCTVDVADKVVWKYTWVSTGVVGIA